MRSILLLPLVARCPETIDGYIWRMYMAHVYGACIWRMYMAVCLYVYCSVAAIVEVCCMFV